MKALRYLLLFLLCLCGCAGPSARLPHTEPAQPVTLLMTPPETIPSPVPEELTASSAAEAMTEAGVPTEPTPAPTEPEPPTIPCQSGDTTPGWDPALAARYPADEDCDPALLLEKWLAVEGLSMADLDARDCRQLILASAQPADGVATLTVCYERDADGAFHPAAGLDRLQGFVGKNGIMHDRRRNTNTSPAGLWAIGMAFGNELPPEGLKLPWRQVTPNSDWVCDEQSPYFNTWQERDSPGLIPWSDDVEHLENYPIHYAWACVIEFNRPPDVVPDRGCAIFLHCAKAGTGGCVGLLSADLYAVLQWLDPARKPYIFITGMEKP